MAGPTDPEGAAGALPPGRPVRPDPVAVRAAALAPLRAATLGFGLVLAALAAGAPSWTGGDGMAALLPGAPAAAALALWWIGRRPAARRVAMALATATAGSLALATAGSLGALERVGGPGGTAVLFQVACLGASLLLLAVSGPCWRRVHAEGDDADARLRMFEEL